MSFSDNQTQQDIAQDITGYRHIWNLSWPVMISNISLPLVGAVDVAMMGHMPEPAFVAGVALGSLIFNFIYLAFAFLRMGTTGFTARAFGARQHKEISLIFARSQVIALTGSIVAIMLTPLILPLAFDWLNASDAATGHMQVYLSIRMWGLPATLANAVTIGWLFGLQSMRLCMFQLLFINLLNIGLNLFFVLILKMDIKGVALASVCAEWTGLCVIISVILLQPRKWPLQLEYVFDRAVFDKQKWGALFAIARDLSLRTLLLWGIEAVLLSQAGHYGDTELAAIQVMLVLFGFIAFGLDGFAHATEALTGVAIGQRARVKLITIIKRATYLAGLTAAVISVGIYFLDDVIIAVMTSQPELKIAVKALWLWGCLMPVAAFLAFQMDGVYVGASSAKQMRNGMVFAFILFVLMIWVFGSTGLDGLLWAFIFYLVFRGVYLVLFLPSIFALCDQDRI